MSSFTTYDGSEIQKMVSLIIRLLNWFYVFVYLQLFIVSNIFITGCYDNVLHMAGCMLNGRDVSSYVNWSIWLPIFGFTALWPSIWLIGNFVGCSIHHYKNR